MPALFSSNSREVIQALLLPSLLQLLFLEISRGFCVCVASAFSSVKCWFLCIVVRIIIYFSFRSALSFCCCARCSRCDRNHHSHTISTICDQPTTTTTNGKIIQYKTMLYSCSGTAVRCECTAEYYNMNDNYVPITWHQQQYDSATCMDSPCTDVHGFAMYLVHDIT